MNKLTLNYSKRKYMIISKKYIDTSPLTLKMNNLSIEHVDCIQYPGVLPDDKLSWKYHIENYTKRFQNMWDNFKAARL